MLILAVPSNPRLLVCFWLLDTDCVTVKDEISAFRFFLDGPSEFISDGMVDMAFKLLPWP